MLLRRNSIARASLRAQAGYTLAELIVVLVILGLSVAVIAPRVLAPSEARDQRQAERLILAAAGQARARAVYNGEEQLLVFDVEAGTVTVAPEGRSQRLPDSVALSVTAALSEIDGDEVAIRFFPDGAATGGEIALVMERVPERRVVVDWATGRARGVGPREAVR